MKNIYRKLICNHGNVVIEFILTTVAMFIPISYLAVAVTNVASAYIQVQDVARTAARVMATSTNEAEGKTKAREIVKDLTDNSPQVFLKISCSHNPCLVDEELVTVEVEKIISLNLPGFTGFSTITVRGKQAEVVQEV